MNKTALCLQMLQILKSRRLVKKEELAGLLETNPRNIVEFRKELETAGYVIEYVPGPHGGYRLEEKGLLRVPDLTNEEISALQEVLAYVSSKDVLLRKEAQRALEKVLSSSITNEEKGDIYQSGTRLSISPSLLQKHYDFLREAISRQKRVRLSYRPKNKEIRQWIIHPYGLFLYRDMWYLVAYREHDHEVTLKLNRIVEMEMTDLSYSVPKDFDISHYANAYGIEIKGENHLVAEIKGRYYLSEYIYGKNQKITVLDDERMRLEVDLANEMAMKSFVLTLGSDCKVISPFWLVEHVRKQAEEMRKIYEGEEK